MSAWSTLFVGGLAGVGLYISVYFTLLTYGIVSPRAPLVPKACRLDGPSCGSVVHTPAARLLAGIPNAVVGIAFYMSVLAALVTDWWFRPGPVAALLVAAAAAVLSGVYLVVQLYKVMGVPCPLCVVAHVVNLLLAMAIGVQLAGIT